MFVCFKGRCGHLMNQICICKHVITMVGLAWFAYGMNRKGGFMQSSTVFPALNAKTEFAQKFSKQKWLSLIEIKVKFS